MKTKGERNTIELAFCIDDNFAIHLCVLLKSIKCNLKKNTIVNCNILGGISIESKRKLNEISDSFFYLTFYGDVNGLEDLYISDRFKDRLSIVTYYRLMIPKILSEKNKVIYFDADMIVLDDISKLWETDLNSFSTGVVEDFVLQKLKRNVFLNLKCNNYFNAGLLVMDLHAWRKNKLALKVIKNLKLHPDYEYNDQDGLNVVLDGDCYYLDEAWNAQASLILNNIDYIKPKVVHFNGQEKPWQISSLHPNTKDYLFYKQQTAYANEPLNYFLDSADHELINTLTQKYPFGCELAIYGCGYRGRRIINYIMDKLSGYDILFVVDKSGGDSYRGLTIFTSYPDKNIDVLLIASIPFRNEIVKSLPENIIKKDMLII